jgi:Uma2 family endonuclease
MTTRANRIERFYDTHEVPGGEGLNQTLAHFYIIRYLINSIEKVFYNQKTGVLSRVSVRLNRKFKEEPDIAVIDGLELITADNQDDYQIGKHGSPPKLVIEITSAITWQKDLVEKPTIYNKMGVNEYFVYGPKNEPVWTGQWRGYNRLIGWRKEAATGGRYELIAKDAQGRLWSEELESWLAVEGNHLQLYTAEGQRRLTKEEAESERAETEAQRAEFERRRAETEARRATEAQLQAEAERQENNKLKELLKKLGHNPDDLL